MGKFLNRRFYFSVIAFICLVLIAQYQNCGGKDKCISVDGSACPGGDSNNGWTINGPASVEISSSPSFTNAPNNFNYSEVVYQRARNLGADAQGCAEIVGVSDGFCSNPANMIPLATAGGWAGNAAANEWINQINASFFHGRTIKNTFKRPSDGAILTRVFSVQSAAAATTSDILLFYSTDVAGNNVITDVKNSAANTYYVHAKNMTVGDYVCNYVVTNPDGSPGTDNCSGTIPPAGGWVQLPAETPDSNNTMWTKQEVSNAFHTTDLRTYLYKNSVKHGPFHFSIHP